MKWEKERKEGQESRDISLVFFKSDKVLKIEEELLAQHCRLYLNKLLNWTKKNEIVNREQALSEYLLSLSLSLNFSLIV